MSDGQRRQGSEVADLVEREQQRWVEPGAGRAGGEASGRLDHVFDERGDERRGGPGAGRRAEHVERPALAAGTKRGRTIRPVGGVTASSTRGSASADKAWRTPSQIESRVRGSEWAACSSALSQPGAAPSRPRIVMASLTAAGSSDQR